MYSGELALSILTVTVVMYKVSLYVCVTEIHIMPTFKRF